MPCRVTYFAQQQSGKLGGWQMNFWNLGNDVNNVRPFADALAFQLFQITGAQVFIPSYRISDLSNFRNVINVLTGQVPQPVTPGNDADYPTTALQFRLKASAGGFGIYKTLQWIRGLPDVIISTSGTYHPTASYAAKIAAFLAVLTSSGNGWAVNVLNRAVAPTPVTAFDSATGIVTAPNHGLGAVGTIVKVRIKGMGQNNPANGLWKVTILTTNTVQINFWTVPAVAVPITGKNPTIRAQVYTQVQIQAADVQQISSHKTGRPTNLLGGRRKTRKH